MNKISFILTVSLLVTLASTQNEIFSKYYQDAKNIA